MTQIERTNGWQIMISKPLQEQTILITGGSRGIGSAIALEMAKFKMKIILQYFRSSEAVQDIAKQCHELGAQVHTIYADLSKHSDIQMLKKKLDEFQLYPDIVINNAGVSHYTLVSEVTEEEWDHVMAVNLKAAFFVSQQFSQHMIQQKYGKIINISSIWGITGASCEVMYSASKGGIIALTKALAKELAPSQITVNAIAPGVVDTQMMHSFTKEDLDVIKAEIPLGRFATTLEIARIVRFLALPDSNYMTGQIISPNGGLHME
jgi:3-oxoacyl-[acyl-carrier protein] reductase